MKASICFMEIGDVRYDGRSFNLASSLCRAGYAVRFLMTGERKLRENLDGIELIQLGLRRWSWSKLVFLQYFIKAFAAAFRAHSDLYVASDLFSLPVAYLVARLRKARLIYDAKELYFAIAALHRRPLTQNLWSLVERFFIKRVDGIMVAGEEDARILSQRYGIPQPTLILNHPPYQVSEGRSDVLRQKLGIPPDKKILLYQGGLQSGRGLFLILEVVRHLAHSVAVFLGDGHLKEELREKIAALGLVGRAFVLDRVEYPKLMEYTRSADLGLALIEDYGLSYRYARPNKLFEYIMAGVPVVVTNFPVMRQIVETHEGGEAVDLNDATEVARVIGRTLTDAGRYKRLVENCRRAAQFFRWENEEPKLLELVQKVLPKVRSPEGIPSGDSFGG
ncbi:MAG: glycosyltransferase [Bacteroidota bacterium]